MKTKQPDRFEREVLAAMKKQDTASSTCIWLNGPDVVKLLRREHQAVVEWSKKAPKYGCWDTAYRDGYNDCVKELQAWLKKRGQ